MKRLLLLWTLINVLLCIPLALISRSQWLKLSSLETLPRETQIVEQDQRRLKQRLALLEAENHASTAELSALQAKLAADSVPDPSPTELQEQLDRLLRQTPEYLHYDHINWRRHVQKWYGDFLKQQSLTPVQIERFKELIVELNASMNDAVDAAVNEGLDAEGKLAQTAVERTKESIKDDIRDLLGEKAFVAYQRSGSIPEPTLENFQLTLADQNLPKLSQDQAQVVAKAYEIRNGYNWDEQTLTRLSKQLSPEQLKALDDYNKASRAAGEWESKIQHEVAATRDKTPAN
ncbi:MAG: hypothetical protein WC661_11180 [Opitutaceae bacterium]|jgi:hypothetical protein